VLKGVFLVKSFNSICYFQYVLKTPFSEKESEIRAEGVLKELLLQVPALNLAEVAVESEARGSVIDIVARVEVSGQPHFLVCEVKRSGQPRHVRDAIHQLRSYIVDFGKPATPVLIAPYLSPASRELCRQNDVSFLDFEGNAHLAFGTVFIDRSTSSKPIPNHREFRSLFKPKSAQVLRILLRDPSRVWRVTELAQAADVSLGHVSNVRTALLDREWAQVVPEGLHLTAPDPLLDAWKSSYEPAIKQQFSFYTTLHGSVLEKSMREIFNSPVSNSQICLASFSAAHWIAPYARTSTNFLYAEPMGVERIKRALRLSSAVKGENVIITVPKDYGVFLDTYEPEPSIRCTSPIQTYLDLSQGGERGEEAAEHLRLMRLTWQK
jgi:hypothetical protein